MPNFQAYNKRINAYVKYHFKDGKTEFFDVKQKNPGKPFKGVPIRNKR